MYDIIFRGIIPHLEQRIINLEEHVASTRKSFKNSMKSLFRFGSKPKPVPESVPELSPSGITMYVDVQSSNCFLFSFIIGITYLNLFVVVFRYPLNTPIAQTRQLADFQFLLRDYEQALYNYKNCANEYKNERTLKFQAGCLEMAGLCYIMQKVHSKITITLQNNYV